MRIATSLLPPLAVLAAGLGAPAAGETLTLDAAGGYIVPVSVNGATLRLRVDPAASGIVVLNPEAAKRARLNPDELQIPLYEKGRMFRHAFARVGSVEIKGSAATRPIVIAGYTSTVRFGWFHAEMIADADGVISPEHLPYDAVEFRSAAQPVGPARPRDERTYEIGVHYAENLGLYYPYPAQGRAVPVQFSLWKDGNVGTAAAGARLADALGGTWAGPVTSSTIAFGISRPVRPMALARPMDVGGLAVSHFLVRTSDHRGSLRLPSDAPADPDEILITASSSSRQPERLQLILGRSQFSSCLSLVYERLRRRITLRCAAPRVAAVGSGDSLPTARKRITG